SRRSASRSTSSLSIEDASSPSTADRSGDAGSTQRFGQFVSVWALLPWSGPAITGATPVRSSYGSRPTPLVRFDCGSQSTRSTRLSRSASAAPRLMTVVVLPTPPLPETHAMDTVTCNLHDSLHCHSIANADRGGRRLRGDDGGLSPRRHARSEPIAQNASILANDDECTECRASRRGGTFPVAAGGDVSNLVHRENPAAAASHSEPRGLYRLLEAAAVGRPGIGVLRIPATPWATALAAPQPDRRGPAGRVERSWTARARRRLGPATSAASQPLHPERMVATALVSWLGRSRRSRSRYATAAR